MNFARTIILGACLIFFNSGVALAGSYSVEELVQTVINHDEAKLDEILKEPIWQTYPIFSTKISAPGTKKDFLVNLAVRQGNVGIVGKLLKLLHDKKSDLTILSAIKKKILPLHIAAEKNDLPMIKLLLSEKYFIDHQDASQQAALHRAVKSGNFEAAELLLSMNANPVIYDILNFTPLDYARQKGLKEIEALLIKYGADFADQLISAIEKGQIALVKTILDKMLINSQSGTLQKKVEQLPRVAVANNHLNILKLLFETFPKLKSSINSPVDSEGNSLLHLAASAGNFDIVKYLVESEANPAAPNKSGENPMNVAYDNHHVKTALYLYEEGANLLSTLFHQLSNAKYSARDIEELLSGSPKLSLRAIQYDSAFAPRPWNQDSDGSLLKFAAKYSNLEKLEVLAKDYKKRVKQNISKYTGFDNPLNLAFAYACELDRLDMAELLVKYGADFHASFRRSFGKYYTVLTEAIENDRIPIIDFLGKLNEKKINQIVGHSNSEDDDKHDIKARKSAWLAFNLPATGIAPLNLAVKKDKPQAVGALLRNHVDPWKDGFGTELHEKSPFFMALEMRRVEVAREFIEAGAFQSISFSDFKKAKKLVQSLQLKELYPCFLIKNYDLPLKTEGLRARKPQQPPNTNSQHYYRSDNSSKIKFE